MRRTLVGAIAVLVLGAGMLAGAAAAQDAAAPTVEAARQVTGDANPARLLNSPAIAVHPDDPRSVAIAAGDTRNGGCALRVSRDAGLSWATTRSFMPDDRPFCIQRNFGRALDVAFAPDGTLHTGMSGSSAETDPPHPNGPVDALAARTTDLGQTYETTVIDQAAVVDHTLRDDSTHAAVEHHKYNTVAVDPSNPDLVYRGWRWTVRGVDQGPVPGWSLGCPDRCAPERTYLAVSRDGGRTWGEPVDLLEVSGLEDVFGANWPSLAVGTDGTVYAAAVERTDRAGDPPPPRFFLFTSPDGGQSWSASTVYEGVRFVGQPEIAIDRASGTLYLAWDQRGDERTSPSDVYFMASNDGGSTWTEATNITDDDPARGVNQYLPGISVAPDGRIDVAWYDYRDDPFFAPEGAGPMGTTVGERWWDVYATWSTDGGGTWAPNLRVTDRSVDGEMGVTFGNQDIRAPIGVAATDAATLVTWSDARAGGPERDVEDVYFTRVRHQGPAPLAVEGTPGYVWAGLGAGVALLVGGLLLIGAARSGRRGPERAPAG